MTLDELATHCRPLASGEELPLLRLDDDAELPGVVAWFGADRARRAVRLLVRGEEAGVLDRTEVYELVSTQSMGYGDADAAILPGLLRRRGPSSSSSAPRPAARRALSTP